VERIVPAHVAQDLLASVLDWELKLKRVKLVVALCLENRLKACRRRLPLQPHLRLLLLRMLRWQVLLQLVDHPLIPLERKTLVMARAFNSLADNVFREWIARVLAALGPLASALALGHKPKLERRDVDSFRATLLRLLMPRP
jgi:hypothetical protein